MAATGTAAVFVDAGADVEGRSGRAPGFGDEIGMYAKHLSSTLRTNSEQLAEAERLQQVQEQELRKMLSQVQIGKKDKAELQTKLDALEKTSQTARQVRVSMGELVTNINPSILGSLADVRIGPSGPSINVTDSSSLFHMPNPFSVEVKGPSSIFRSPNPLSVEVKSPSSLIGPGQSPPSIGTDPSSKSAASKAAFRRFRRRKQGDTPAAKKP